MLNSASAGDVRAPAYTVASDSCVLFLGNPSLNTAICREAAHSLHIQLLHLLTS